MIKSYVFLNCIMYICMYAFIISVYLAMFIFHLLCNLGVLFDAKFCFTNHVNSVIKSCFTSLRDLHRLRRFLSVDTSVVIANDCLPGYDLEHNIT